jgi:hypothetical protein
LWGRSFLDALAETAQSRAPTPKPLALVPRLWRNGGALAG